MLIFGVGCGAAASFGGVGLVGSGLVSGGLAFGGASEEGFHAGFFAVQV